MFPTSTVGFPLKSLVPALQPELDIQVEGIGELLEEMRIDKAYELLSRILSINGSRVT